MTGKQATRISKFLSLVLRHEPERAGLTLDSAGWVAVEALLSGVNQAGVTLSLNELQHVVATSPKQRFAFSADGQRIRASQGHSVDVDLEYQPQVPPEILYHGTADQFAEVIQREGLRKMSRHHVHLAAETVVTLQVGARRGKPVLAVIRAGEMHRDGHVFYRATNGVWLVDHVPPHYLTFEDR